MRCVITMPSIVNSILKSRQSLINPFISNSNLKSGIYCGQQTFKSMCVYVLQRLIHEFRKSNQIKYMYPLYDIYVRLISRN